MSPADLSPHDVLRHPYVTEKAMMQMEWENTLDFVVHDDATKPQVKWAFEELFHVEVASVRTRWTPRGVKHAVIKLTPDHSAEEIAMEIGVF